MKNNTFGWDLEQSVSAKPCLKQGDLIVFPEEVDETRRVAIVVTADCDLERKKHANSCNLGASRYRKADPRAIFASG